MMVVVLLPQKMYQTTFVGRGAELSQIIEEGTERGIKIGKWAGGYGREGQG